MNLHNDFEDVLTTTRNKLLHYNKTPLNMIQFRPIQTEIYFLNIGETLNQQVQRACNGVSFLNIVNESALQNIYMSNIQTYKNIKIPSQWIEYNSDTSAKEEYLEDTRNIFIQEMSEIKDMIMTYDAKLRQLKVANTNEIVQNVNNLLKLNHYKTYAYLMNLLHKYFSDKFDTLSGTIVDVYLDYRLFPKQAPTYDDIYLQRRRVFNEDTTAETVYSFFKRRILGTDDTNYKPFTFEEMKELFFDMEAVFESISYIPYVDHDMVFVLNKMLEIAYELATTCNEIAFIAELVCIDVSRVTNEQPYEMGSVLLNLNEAFNVNARRSIRLNIGNKQ